MASFRWIIHHLSLFCWLKIEAIETIFSPDESCLSEFIICTNTHCKTDETFSYTCVLAFKISVYNFFNCSFQCTTMQSFWAGLASMPMNLIRGKCIFI